MKKLILISLTLLLTTFIYGQTFAPLGAKWYYSSEHGGTAPFNSEYYLYESKLDTVIAGHSCKKISVTYFQYLNGDTAYLPPVFTYQSTDTVFYFNSIYSRYFPLYIFNVVQGDTLIFHSPDIPYPLSDTTWRAVVDSVTNLIISSDTLIRVWTSPLDNYAFYGSYIEKLGCDFLMFPQNGLIMESDGPMRCYSDSTISYNFSSLSCDFRLTTGINKIDNLLEFSIFPNPTNDIINIVTINNKQQHYKIYNSLGQLIMIGVLLQKTSISIDNFNNGIYNIQLTTDTKTYRKTFIVNK